MKSILQTQLIDQIKINELNLQDDWIDAKKRYLKETAAFRKKFTPEKIRQLSVEDYAPGNQQSQSFCTQIERHVSAGSISGTTSDRFGVFYNSKIGGYQATKYLGGDVEKGLELIKSEIIKLVTLKEPITRDAHRNSLVSNMFKNKILHVYHPDHYLSIYSDEHLYWINDRLKVPYDTMCHFDAHHALFDFKRNHELFSQLSNWEFGTLIYRTARPQSRLTTYGDFAKKKSKRYSGKASKTKSKNITLSDFDQVGQKHKSPGKRNPGKGNYERTNLENMKTGLEGELVVIEYLMREYGLDEKDIDHVAKRDDSAGFDIQVNIDGSDHYIEVKASTTSITNARIFLTENEKDQAELLGANYYIYLVGEVFDEPTVTIIKNPFFKPHPTYQINCDPVKYQISFTNKKT